MASITIQFAREKHFYSSLISWFTEGDLSHVDAVLSDGSLLGAYESQVGAIPPGVYIRPAGYREWVRQVRFTIPCTDEEFERWHTFMLAQIGAAYDWSAIWGFLLGHSVKSVGRYICSAYQAAGLMKSLIIPPVYLDPAKISPNALALLVSSIRGVTRQDIR